MYRQDLGCTNIKIMLPSKHCNHVLRLYYEKCFQELYDFIPPPSFLQPCYFDTNYDTIFALYMRHISNGMNYTLQYFLYCTI